MIGDEVVFSIWYLADYRKATILVASAEQFALIEM
jgi:hypothetical protein